MRPQGRAGDHPRRDAVRAPGITARLRRGQVRPPIRGGADPPTPTARALIVTFLRQRPTEIWCSECLGHKLDLRPGRAANVFLLVEGMQGFRRVDRPCIACGQRRLALTCVGGLPDAAAGEADGEDTGEEG